MSLCIIFSPAPICVSVVVSWLKIKNYYYCGNCFYVTERRYCKIVKQLELYEFASYVDECRELTLPISTT